MYPNDHILVVEDDSDHYMLIADGLSRGRVSNTIVRASTADEAFRYLQGEGAFANRDLHPLPCLILLDLNLPDKSGFTVLEWVRDQAEFKKLPVVVLTVSQNSADLEKAYSLGANSYLQKPFALSELQALVKSINAYWILHAQKPRT